jgi:hypothetical protein
MPETAPNGFHGELELRGPFYKIGFRLLLPRDVLDLRDEPRHPTVGIPHRRNMNTDLDDLAVRVDVPLLDLVAVAFSRQDLFEQR